MVEVKMWWRKKEQSEYGCKINVGDENVEKKKEEKVQKECSGKNYGEDEEAKDKEKEKQSGGMWNVEGKKWKMKEKGQNGGKRKGIGEMWKKKKTAKEEYNVEGNGENEGENQKNMVEVKNDRKVKENVVLNEMVMVKNEGKRERRM